jgi:hydrogenase maturation factor
VIPEPRSCPTCADAAVQALVVRADGPTALVEHDGGRETVALDLVGPVPAGAVLLCHAGIALQRLEPR